MSLEGSTISFCFWPEVSLLTAVLFSGTIDATSVRLVTLACATTVEDDDVSFWTVKLAIVRFGKMFIELLPNIVMLGVALKFGEGSSKMLLFGM